MHSDYTQKNKLSHAQGHAFLHTIGSFQYVQDVRVSEALLCNRALLHIKQSVLYIVCADRFIGSYKYYALHLLVGIT